MQLADRVMRSAVGIEHAAQIAAARAPVAAVPGDQLVEVPLGKSASDFKGARRLGIGALRDPDRERKSQKDEART